MGHLTTLTMQGSLTLRINEGAPRNLDVKMTQQLDLAKLMESRDFHVVDGKGHIHLTDLELDLTIPEDALLREAGADLQAEIEQELYR